MNEEANRNYRMSHQSDQIATEYDHGFRDPGSATGSLWHLEQPLLHDFLSTNQAQIKRSLDFACGTGRILQLVENYVDDCTGVDISPNMLKIAKTVCKKAVLIEGDVTNDKDLAQGPFDLVTAFRFFLQAEEPLRFEVLQWIRSVISDEGYFVANFHLNPRSIRGLYRRAYARVKGKKLRSMTVPYVESMLHDYGFEVEELTGYSHMFYRSGPGGNARIRNKVDEFITKQKLFPRLGSSFLIVARPR